MSLLRHIRSNRTKEFNMYVVVRDDHNLYIFILYNNKKMCSGICENVCIPTFLLRGSGLQVGYKNGNVMTLQVCVAKPINIKIQTCSYTLADAAMVLA